jgi:predicted RNA-binding Zn ribbon-like protein
LHERAAIELINSDLPGEPDLLDDPAALASSLERWGLATADPDLRELRRLRGVLRTLAASISDRGDVTAEDLAVLNAELARAPAVAQLEFGGDGLLVDMKPVAERWSDRAAVELGGSFAAVLRSATPPRLKLCANAGCGRAFYDSSRNRSRRWCDSRSCGNRARVRRHRARARGNL